jgi:hypothetical protein
MDTAVPRISAPIVIYAFNRADYLERLCLSLKAQQGVSFTDRDVHLLQDGAVSRRSNVRYTEQALIDANISTFRQHFPKGHVHAAPYNLGIALNLQRGESLVFEKLNAEVGYFFEEDLELGPCYLAMMEAIRAQVAAHPTVGYFACYGNHRLQPDPARPRFVPLEHHWGFGLTKACWTAMQPWLAPFIAIWKETDYQGRPHLRLVEAYLDKAVASNQSSQDVSKTLACADLGFTRINTDVCYARYIGARGESFNPAKFETARYDEMAYADSMPEQMPQLAAEQVAAFAATKRAHQVRIRETEFDNQLAEMRRRLTNPDRPASREDILEIWRVLLDRVPDNEDYFARNVGNRTVRQIRTSLLRGKEAASKSFYRPAEPG